MSLLERIDGPADVRALPVEALPALCEDLRSELISVCGRVGGHLGASLGVVELTVALHRVFKSPVDRLVWDVGHQAYAHKLLTGRRARFETLRQAGGVAPFIDPAESPHDAFGVGHACTAISAALGLARAKQLQGQPGDVVAIVGDGALTGGEAFEGLNNAGQSGLALKLVVNDNGMSISSNVGAVPVMLRSRARAFFEALGFAFLSTVDGHSLQELDHGLRELQRCQKPAVLHVVTEKGRGFGPAEGDAATRGHAMGPYELREGKLVRSRQGQPTFSDVWAATLERHLARDARVVVITPAMIEGSSLAGLKARFPSRVFDVGIAEQHAVTFAAGLAQGGLRPIVCVYSTFLQRAYDQVIHDVVLPRLPVVLAVDRAGLVGADGATHQGAFDLSMLRALPGLVVATPAFGDDLDDVLAHALTLDGPVALRFPRGVAPARPPTVAKGDGLQPRWMKRGSELTFVAAGPAVLTALQAAESEPGWGVLDARTVEPLDEAAMLEAAAGAIVTVEEASPRGGLGSAVLECLARHRRSTRVRVVALPADAFVRHGEARAQRAELGLDVEGLRRAARETLAP